MCVYIYEIHNNCVIYTQWTEYTLIKIMNIIICGESKCTLSINVKHNSYTASNKRLNYSFILQWNSNVPINTTNPSENTCMLFIEIFQSNFKGQILMFNPQLNDAGILKERLIELFLWICLRLVNQNQV